jgi:hypothetical protein
MKPYDTGWIEIGEISSESPSAQSRNRSYQSPIFDSVASQSPNVGNVVDDEPNSMQIRTPLLERVNDSK